MKKIIFSAALFVAANATRLRPNNATKQVRRAAARKTLPPKNAARKTLLARTRKSAAKRNAIRPLSKIARKTATKRPTSKHVQ